MLHKHGNIELVKYKSAKDRYNFSKQFNLDWCLRHVDGLDEEIIEVHLQRSKVEKQLIYICFNSYSFLGFFVRS